MKPRIDRRLALTLSRALIQGRSRSPLEDATRLLRQLPLAPRVLGTEHLPHGRIAVMANHYQRSDLWIGWAGALITSGTARDVRWLTLRELRLGSVALPLTRTLFTRVALTYGFIPVPFDRSELEGHALAVRSALRQLDAGETIGWFPEGRRGHSRGLSPALPHSDRFAALLARQAPLVPAAVWEDCGRLTVRFGPAIDENQIAGGDLMAHLAALLPDA